MYHGLPRACPVDLNWHSDGKSQALLAQIWPIESIVIYDNIVLIYYNIHICMPWVQNQQFLQARVYGFIFA